MRGAAGGTEARAGWGRGSESITETGRFSRLPFTASGDGGMTGVVQMKAVSQLKGGVTQWKMVAETGVGFGKKF